MVSKRRKTEPSPPPEPYVNMEEKGHISARVTLTYQLTELTLDQYNKLKENAVEWLDYNAAWHDGQQYVERLD